MYLLEPLQGQTLEHLWDRTLECEQGIQEVNEVGNSQEGSKVKSQVSPQEHLKGDLMEL